MPTKLPVNPASSFGRKRNRAAILEAAHTLLRVKGPDCLTIADIACEAGVSRRTIYNHFADMPALFEESRRTLLARIVPLVPTVITSLASPQQALARFGHQAMRVFDASCHSGLVNSLIRDGETHDWAARAYETDILEPMTDALAAYLVCQGIQGEARAKAGQVVQLLQSISFSHHVFSRTGAAEAVSIEHVLASVLGPRWPRETQGNLLASRHTASTVMSPDVFEGVRMGRSNPAFLDAG